MRHEVYTINGLAGVARSYKSAMLLVPRSGPFVILAKDRKNSYPHQGYRGQNGITYQSTMLLYPPDAKCQMWKPEDYAAAVGVSLAA